MPNEASNATTKPQNLFFGADTKPRKPVPKPQLLILLGRQAAALVDAYASTEDACQADSNILGSSQLEQVGRPGSPEQLSEQLGQRRATIIIVP